MKGIPAGLQRLRRRGEKKGEEEEEGWAGGANRGQNRKGGRGGSRGNQGPTGWGHSQGPGLWVWLSGVYMDPLMKTRDGQAPA